MRLLGLFAVLDVAAGVTIDLLSNQRKDYQKVIPFTLKEKERMLKSVSSLYDLYVNRLLKINDYQTERPGVDGIPRFEKLAKNLGNVTDLEFHLELLDIINSQCDMYLTYSMPAPYNCVTLRQPIYFSSYGAYPDFTIFVKNQYDRKPYNELAPDVKKFKDGDEVLQVDGVDIKQHLKDLKWENHGPTAASMVTSGTSFMAVRQAMFVTYPKKDFVQYKIKRDTGEILDLRLPWIVEIIDDCYANNGDVKKTVTENITVEVFESEISADTANALSLQSIEIESTEAGFSFIQTPDNAISWGIYRPNNQNLGIIKISPYGADDDFSTTSSVFDTIYSLVTNELKGTAGLLIDVTQTQYGMSQLSNLLPQLFSPEFQVPLARVIKSRVNDLIFSANSSYYNDNWKKIYQETPAGQLYTNAVPFNEDVKVDQIGQIYAGPVGILTGGNTNREAEIFVANMQDYGNNVIFGESITTGGGGSTSFL